MTHTGGSSDDGAAFSMNLDGSGYTLLHTFNGGGSDGAFPQGELTLSGSKLYCMTYRGGSGNDGAAFSMNLDGSGFTLLHTFTGGSSDGKFPAGSLTLSGSKLYGMTEEGGSSLNSGDGYGTLFSMNLDGTGFTLLQSFAGKPDGALPQGDVTLSSDGSKLYGMTFQGGTTNDGTVFSFSVAVPAPEPGTALFGFAISSVLFAARRRNGRV